MKKLLFVFLLFSFGRLSAQSTAYLDYTNSDHIDDPFSSTYCTFTYNLDPNGHTLHCYWTFWGLPAGTIIQPALYVKVVYGDELVGFNDYDHSFYANGGTQYFSYDVELGSTAISFDIAAGYDNLSDTDPYYYNGAGGEDEMVGFVP